MLVTEKLPLFALAAASCFVTLAAQDRGGAVTSLEHLSFAERLRTAVVAYGTYLGMAVWPTGLAPYYPTPLEGWPAVRVAVAALAVAGLTALAVWQRRRRPYLLAGWLWYVGTLVPVIGLVQVGGQAYADRYTYLPMIGPAVAVVWAGAELAADARRRVPLLTVTGAAVALLAALTWRQAGYWHDDLTLWPHTVSVTAPNASAHTSFGLALEKQPCRLSEAIDHYAEAVRIVPTYTTARVLLGLALEKQGRTEDAIRHYREALRTDPRMAEAHHNLGVALAKTGNASEAVEHYRAALRLDHEMAASHRNLANLLESRGEVREAIAHYREAARIDPDDGVAHGRLGLALARQGDLNDAAGHLERAAELLPGSAAVWFTLGTTRESLGRAGEAAECFRRAVALEPKNLRNRLRLAAALARQGDDAAAEAEYRAASRLNPRWPEQLCRDAWQLATGPDPHGRDGRLAVEMAESACRAVKPPPAAFLDALAAAYAEAGRFPDAAAAADRALATVDAAQEPDLARAIAGRLALYRERRPFHESTADGPR
jgi:tetratricopeptide (TPR) repeat protein